MMKKIRISPFYIVLLVFIVAVLIFTEVGKGKLRDLLAEYEGAQVKYVAADILDEHLVAGDGEKLAAFFADSFSEYETKEHIAAYLAELTRGKELSLQTMSSGLDSAVQYAVKCDGKKFAAFSLKKSGEKTAHGIDLYTLDAAQLNPKLLTSFSIQIPKGYSLTVNGRAADAKYCLGDDVTTPSEDFMPEGVHGILYTTYTFDRLCAAPDFAVQSGDGRDSTVRFDDEKAMYTADILYDDALAAQYGDYAKAAAMAYATYMQNDASFAQIKKYFDPSSAIYKNLRTSATMWVIDHNSYEFRDVTASEFYAYSDDVFSCRVSLTHVLKYRGLKDYNDYVDMTFYFRNVDGTFLIYNSFNNK